MDILTHNISRATLTKIAKNRFGNLVKAVVDVRKHIMVIDADMHADEEAALIANGSNQDDLWGINLYPEFSGEDFIEFDSMINLRPSAGNNTRGVDKPETQLVIRAVVNALVSE